MYIFILDLITSLVPVVTVFFPQFFDPPYIQGFLSLLYYPFSSIYTWNLHPPRVNQVVGFDSYPISTFLKSLGVAVRLKITIRILLPH